MPKKMLERGAPRRRVLKAGTIAFNKAGGISCTVRNISDTGACLEVASPIGIPDAFTLAINSDHMQYPCCVAWRSHNRVGVAFK
jgi:PilZ domain